MSIFLSNHSVYMTSVLLILDLGLARRAKTTRSWKLNIHTTPVGTGYIVLAASIYTGFSIHDEN